MLVTTIPRPHGSEVSEKFNVMCLRKERSLWEEQTTLRCVASVGVQGVGRSEFIVGMIFCADVVWELVRLGGAC